MSGIRVAWRIGLILVAVTAMGCSSSTDSEPEQPAPELFDQAAVSVTGKVLPATRAELSMRLSGVIDEVMVSEGDIVTEGQVLLTLDAPELTAAVALAEAGLQAAEAQLALLRAGASAEELAVAQAAVSVAEQNAATARAAVTIAEAGVASAQAGVEASQAALDLLQAGARSEEIAVAQQQVEQAKSQLYALQSERDTVGGHKDNPGYDASAYDAILGQVYAAEDAVEIAELNLSMVQQGARTEEVAGAEAQVSAAKAALAAAQAELAAAQQDALTAQAQVDQARAELARIAAPPRTEQLATAEAGVAQARAALDSAQAAAGQARLVAPFAGTIGRLDARPGELVTPAQAVISLGDLSALIIETTDLDEIDVARVQVGSPVTIEFDALTGVELDGTVSRIAPMAGSGSGGTTFTVYIALAEQPPELCWGMTAFADISTD